MKKIIIILSTICSFAVNAEVIVTKIVGHVTVLKPGHRTADEVKLNEKLSDDSSILTHEKSGVQLEYKDKTKINVGPNSKIVLNQIRNNNKEEKPSVITMLKGMLRAKVEKAIDPKTETFIIKTKTASMGVRGTEFQFGFNDENNTTSLLTFEGTVELSKEIPKDEDLKKPTAFLIKGEKVKEGEFSSVAVKKEDSTKKENKEEIVEVLKPVKIDTKQFQLIANNSLTMDNTKKIEPVKVESESKAPVIDFSTGKIYESKKELDQSGNVLDVNSKNEETTQEIKESFFNFELEQEWTDSIVKYSFNEFRFSSKATSLHMKHKIQGHWFDLTLRSLGGPDLEKSDPIWAIMGIKVDRYLKLGFLFDVAYYTLGDINAVSQIGIAQKNRYLVSDSVLHNDFEDVPVVGTTLNYKVSHGISTGLGTQLYLSNQTDIGLVFNPAISYKMKRVQMSLGYKFDFVKDQKDKTTSLSASFDW